MLCFLMSLAIVLLPYEITLFSNYMMDIKHFLVVLLPYEITLFSNKFADTKNKKKVLLPYKITLFSNYSMLNMLLI